MKKQIFAVSIVKPVTGGSRPSLRRSAIFRAAKTQLQLINQRIFFFITLPEEMAAVSQRRQSGNDNEADCEETFFLAIRSVLEIASKFDEAQHLGLGTERRLKALQRSLESLRIDKRSAKTIQRRKLKNCSNIGGMCCISEHFNLASGKMLKDYTARSSAPLAPLLTVFSDTKWSWST